MVSGLFITRTGIWMNVWQLCFTHGVPTRVTSHSTSSLPNGPLVRALHRLARRLTRWLVGRIDLLGGSLPEGSPVRSELPLTSSYCPDYQYLARVLDVSYAFGTLVTS